MLQSWIYGWTTNIEGMIKVHNNACKLIIYFKLQKYNSIYSSLVYETNDLTIDYYCDNPQQSFNNNFKKNNIVAPFSRDRIVTQLC